MTARKATKPFLVKMATELEKVVQPQNDKGEPISLATGTLKDIQQQIKEAANMLNADDKISDDLKWLLLDHFKLELSLVNTNGTDEGDGDWTLDEIMDLDRAGLVKLCKDSKLISENDDYKEVGDFRIAVAEEMGFEIPVKEEAPKAEEDKSVKEKTSTKKTSTKKTSTKKTSTKKTSTKKTSTKISNKLLVYQLYQKKGDSTIDELLAATAEGSLKRGTVTSWVSQWKKGNKIPAGAK